MSNKYDNWTDEQLAGALEYAADQLVSQGTRGPQAEMLRAAAHRVLLKGGPTADSVITWKDIEARKEADLAEKVREAYESRGKIFAIKRHRELVQPTPMLRVSKATVEIMADRGGWKEKGRP